MAKKQTVPQKSLELSMLDECLDRLAKIGKRQPLPTQHFYVEASEIIREAIFTTYANGVEDGKSGETTFPVGDYTSK